MFGKGMGNMAGMMKKVQKMQADMKKMQEELKTRTVEASVGGGAVTVVMNGEKIIESLKLNPTAVDPEDVEMLENSVAIQTGIKRRSWLLKHLAMSLLSSAVVTIRAYITYWKVPCPLWRASVLTIFA